MGTNLESIADHLSQNFFSNYLYPCFFQIVKQHQLTSTARPPACLLDVTERGIRITEHPVAGQRRVMHGIKK